MVRRVDIIDVLSMQDVLDTRLAREEIDTDTYVNELNELLIACGWSEDEYVDQISRYWTAVREKRTPVTS